MCVHTCIYVYRYMMCVCIYILYTCIYIHDVYVYICIYIHDGHASCKHTFKHTHTHLAHTYTHTYTIMMDMRQIYVHAYMYICIHIHDVCIYIHIVYKYIYMMCVYIYILYINTYIHDAYTYIHTHIMDTRTICTHCHCHLQNMVENDVPYIRRDADYYPTSLESHITLQSVYNLTPEPHTIISRSWWKLTRHTCAGMLTTTPHL